MKKMIVLWILFLVSTSTAQQTTQMKDVPPPEAASKTLVQRPDPPLLPPPKTMRPLFGQLLKSVAVSKTSFNPSRDEEVAIAFDVTKPCKVAVNLYDADHGLIRALVRDQSMAEGRQSLPWDGRDSAGVVVADEAYFFTIIAEDDTGLKEIYDPTIFSGGIEHDITSAEVDVQNQTISYKLEEMARVLIRIGVESGPLMNTLVDWKPRVNGAVTEYWNGKDKDNLVDIYNHPKFKMIITYFSLPDNSIICFGNRALDYRGFKKALADRQSQKPKRGRSIDRASPHYGQARTLGYSPELKIELKNVHAEDEKGSPILKGRALVRVELEEEDKVNFLNLKFEIVFFLDYQFYAEDEAGYTPFNWVWDLSNVSEGEHLLTVNLSSYKDQIGVWSGKIKVVK